MSQISDLDIFDCLIQNEHTNTDKVDQIEVLLKGARELGVHTNQECIDFLGIKQTESNFKCRIW